jgi:hypothetical protein
MLLSREGDENTPKGGFSFFPGLVVRADGLVKVSGIMKLEI